MGWDEKDLIAKGFVKNGDGTWSKGERHPLVETKAKIKSKPTIERPDLSHCLFIPGHVPSSKNSRRNFQPKDSEGRPILTEKGKIKSVSLKSEAVVKYISESLPYWERNYSVWKKMIAGQGLPLHIRFHFARKTANEFDWINPAQTIQDIMVKVGYLKDDSTKYINPSFGYEWVDQERPGVYIEVVRQR